MDHHFYFLAVKLLQILGRVFVDDACARCYMTSRWSGWCVEIAVHLHILHLRSGGGRENKKIITAVQ